MQGIGGLLHQFYCFQLPPSPWHFSRGFFLYYFVRVIFIAFRSTFSLLLIISHPSLSKALAVESCVEGRTTCTLSKLSRSPCTQYQLLNYFTLLEIFTVHELTRYLVYCEQKIRRPNRQELVVLLTWDEMCISKQILLKHIKNEFFIQVIYIRKEI